jgi:hypothetical protein
MVPLHWESKGGIIFSVAACNGLPAPDVIATLTPEADPPETVLYLSDMLMLQPMLTATSDAGLGAVLNVEPTPKRLTLKLKDGRLVGQYDFGVALGATTTLSLAPAPRNAP